MKYQPNNRSQERALADAMRADAAVYRQRRAAQDLLLAREAAPGYIAPTRVVASESPYEPTLNGYSIGHV